MAVSVSQLETYLSAAATAAAAGNHATRIANLRAALDIALGLPASAAGGTSVRYDPNAIRLALDDAKMAETAASFSSTTGGWALGAKHKRVNEDQTT